MTETRIVETVTATTMADLRNGRAHADAGGSAGPDLVELRLDGVRDLDVAGALSGRKRPVVVTCRPTWEGGAFDGSEEERQRILAEAVNAGAEYVDIERRATWRPDLTGRSTGLVLSEHDFAGMPADLSDRLAAMRAEHPAIVKVAVMTHSASDCARLMHLAPVDAPTVVIGMGSFGWATRVLPGRFGSVWTYGGQAAPGQVPVSALLTQFRVRDVTSQSAVYAVTGRPLAHSASPAMHNAAFAALGYDAVYVPLEAVSGADAFTLAEALGVRGVSVTAPLKQSWADCSVTLDDSVARALGTVNTLKRTADGWLGRNVDGDGFLDPLVARHVQLKGLRVTVLGAGGAARSVAFTLLDRGARVAISARRTDAAAALAGALGADIDTWPPSEAADLLVNATSVGTWPDVDESPLAAEQVRAPLVYDLVYNPEETALLRAARTAGARVIGGLEMLVGQAVRQSQWWTGQQPSADVMTRAARNWIAHALESDPRRPKDATGTPNLERDAEETD